MATGIRERHGRYEAWAFDKRATYVGKDGQLRKGKKIRKSFDTFEEAKAWRAEASTAVRKRTLKASSRQTVREAWEAWEKGALDGSVRTRSGDHFKPSALRGYAASMRLHVLDDLGAAKLSDVSRLDLQDLADRLLAAGRDPSTIRNALMPLRAVYRRAVARGDVAVNPTSGLELPAVRGRRNRIADPGEAARLIAAVPEDDRAVWATAAYAGLRSGELQALRHEDVDLDAGLIHVRRSWDKVAGPVEPKSGAGRRAVPIVAALRSHLAAHLLRSRARTGLVFGESERPFVARDLSRRAERAWKAAELKRITLHELRHSAASLFIAAGVNAKALSTFLGHSSITITLDRYGHLFPGAEDEAAALVDAYLERTAGAETGANGPQPARLSQTP